MKFFPHQIILGEINPNKSNARNKQDLLVLNTFAKKNF